MSVRSAVLKRPERVESAAWSMLSNSYAASVMGRSAVGDQLQPEREGTAKQVNRYAGEFNREKDAGSAVLFPVATSAFQSVGQGIRLGSGYHVRRSVRLGKRPSQTPIGRARCSIPLGRSGMGGRSES